MSGPICNECKQPMDRCGCDRMQHVWSPQLGACMFCGEKFKPNGTGPQNAWYTWIIRLSPFNRNCDPISDNHDVDYFEGYTRKHKKSADERMYLSTKEMVMTKKVYWPKWFWVRRAKLNFIAVDEGGDDSFNWQGCKGE